jgi:hypothetical protein
MRLIVFIPHRDTESVICQYRQQLFAAQVLGAWSFPVVAPVAHVTRAYTKQELLSIARYIRALSYEDERDGRIRTGMARSYQLGADITLYGLALDVPVIPDTLFPSGTLVQHFPLLTLSAAVINAEQQHVPPAPVCSFRTGSLANMTVTPFAPGVIDLSYRWRIGERVWLPRAVSDTSSRQESALD